MIGDRAGKSPKKREGAAPAADASPVRDALVAAGRRLVERTPVDKLSLRGIAAEAGVSVAAPAYFFGNKDGLLAAVAVTGFADLLGRRRAIGARQLPSAAKARLMLTSYFEFALENPGVFQLMFGPRIFDKYSYDDLRDLAAESLAAFTSALAAHAREKGWDAADLRYVAHAAWTVEHGIATLLLAQQVPVRSAPVEVVRFAEFSVAMILSAIDAGPDRLAHIAAESLAADYPFEIPSR